MNTVKVRNIEIGSGVPKICVPIVGVTKDEIIAEAKTFDSIPVDVVEWRVDWFEGVFEFDKVEDVLKDLREALGETPILFTFRTSKEGGEKAIEYFTARTADQPCSCHRHCDDRTICMFCIHFFCCTKKC